MTKNIPSKRGRGRASTLARLTKYTLVRGSVLFLTVVVAVYGMILVANLGGYVDEVVKANIDFAIGQSLAGSDETPAQRLETFERLAEAAYEAAGLNEPFVLRCFRWLGRGLTLDWGETRIDASPRAGRPRPIRTVVAESLPRTLLIFGLANLLLFFTTIALALPLSRKQGGWVDQLVIGLSPLSAAPAWVYGIILNLVMVRLVGSVLGSGTFDAWPDQVQLAHFPIYLRHLALPTAAIFLSGLFHGIYAWRSLFSLHSQEDYVEMAVAKGLPKSRLERQYILRPLLPSVLTSFAILFVNLWQEVIVLEHFFEVAGIGRLFWVALRRYNTPVIVALVVTFAYLLAITVFVLDILYAWLDPRVGVGGSRQSAHAVSTNQGLALRPRVLWNRLRRLGDRLTGERGRARATSPWRGFPAGALKGSEALERILGGFPRAEHVEVEVTGAGGGRRTLRMDRLYPELGLALRFARSDGSREGDRVGVARQEGLVVLEIDPDAPLGDAVLEELRAALGAAARRVAQRAGSSRIKATLVPRIAAAKAACDRMLNQLEEPHPVTPEIRRREWWRAGFDRGGLTVGATLRGFSRYPAAALGVLVIVAMIGISIATMIVLPYDEMVDLWRSGADVWAANPRAVPPVWVNLFRREDLPTTIQISSPGGTSGHHGAEGEASAATKETTVVSEHMTEITIVFPFEFPYGAFPQDVSISVSPKYEEKRPLITFSLVTPDGREIELKSDSIDRHHTYRVSLDERLRRRMDGQDPIVAIFAEPGVEPATPLKGSYELRVQAFVFEEGADADAELVVYGQVHGMAGTDRRRRDLMIPLLWGMPLALAFGLVAAVGTSFTSMAVAGVGAWFGGWVDSLVQRISEVSMILPFLPVALLVYTLHSKSIWAILGVMVLIISLGHAVKSYRAIFLQVREAGYVEAAQAYGASDRRIVFSYLIPRIVPVMIPQLVVLVPSYVFLEATLAFLGVSDPVLPTWGKLIVEGLSRGIYTGETHLFLEPLGLLLLIAFSFILVGVALERIFEPRLRED